MEPQKSWSVEYHPTGREGYLFYHEESRSIPFYWELGGGAVLLIVRFDEPGKFVVRYPWTAARRKEILTRLSQEIIRQKTPGCNAEIDEQNICIYIREQTQ